MPYRSRKDKARMAAVTEGPVAEMVRQFADPYAFVRELVQNGIDAGATMMEVRVRHVHGSAVYSVRDDGSGMTREIIEGPLLTLFSSSKDHDTTKIGKYGVGFVSVFAIDPDEVVVESWRPGQSWHLTLRPDHTYELAHGELQLHGPSGTIVSLRKGSSADAFAEGVEQVHAALVRWCRHAQLPIHWRVDQVSGQGRHERVDEALAVDSPCCIRAEVDGMTIVVGPAAGDEPLSTGFAGFYKRGLTLYETELPPTPGLIGLRFKVDATGLQHTLSRDNVRHDDAYRAAIRRVEELAGRPLRREIAERLAQSTAEVVRTGHSDKHAALVAAACDPRRGLARASVALPLVAPLPDGRTTCSAAELELGGFAVYAAEPSVLTAALAASGRAVLRSAVPERVLVDLATFIGCSIHRADTLFALLSPLGEGERSTADTALLEGLHRALDAAGYAVPAVGLAECHGTLPDRAAIGVASATASQLVALTGKSHGFRQLLGARSILVSTGHEATEEARRVARVSPTVAANLLARYLLVEELGELPKSACDGLLEGVS